MYSYAKVLLLIIAATTISAIVCAQSPEKMSYQAVIRNAENALLVNQSIGMRVSILQGEINGASVYTETHSINTNANGLATLEIGEGEIVSGIFSEIDWANGPYFILSEIDPEGGNNYTITSSSQLMSVPYALYAKTAGNSPPRAGEFEHYIGEFFQGGVIFHLWKDADGMEHGLIVDIVDVSSSYAWSNVEEEAVGAQALSSWDGLGASSAIINQTNHTYSAAALCLNSISDAYDDWYLPSIDELIKVCQQRFNINKTLATIQGAVQIPIMGNYWSSTESAENFAWAFNFSSESALDYYKGTTLSVRAIRQF